MHGWQFDDLTRALGKATSRRQVFKGLLAGLAGAAVAQSATMADTGCDVAQCKADADALYQEEYQACGQNGSQGAAACTLWALTQRYFHEKRCDRTGCFDGSCCSGQCVSLYNDPQNCGRCGHACPAGADCVRGRCQCPDDLTYCKGQCVDTQSDQNNCGACGHACASCEACVTGQCVPIECLDGQTCCQGNCVPLCPSGDAPDPSTCQCNVCQGQSDGAACDANDASKLCCQQQCVSNQCPSGKSFSLDTCRCQCTNTCPPDQLQDPDTCQCQDLCANVTCPECQTCDPTSGDCVQADDRTPCGTNQVCCSGVCQDSCGTCAGLPCSNGDCCPNSTAWACCLDGCCPQVTINGQSGAWCVAPGAATDPFGLPSGNCCQPSHLVKGRYLNSDGQCDCSSEGGAFAVWCDNNLGTDIIGTRCSCGYWES